jgi:ribosomal protein L16 Arg81 hydroxylase
VCLLPWVPTPDIGSQVNPGQITSKAVKKVQKILTQYIEDQNSLAQWFGRYMTSHKYLDEKPSLEEHHLGDVHNHLAAGGKLIRNEGSRFAFQEYGKSLWLFVDGRQYMCGVAMTELVKALCAKRTFSNLCKQGEEHDFLLLDLLNHGSLYLSD